MAPVRILIALLIPLLLMLAVVPVAQAKQDEKAHHPKGPVLDEFEQEVLASINEARHDEGLPSLRSSRMLSRSASRHSRDQLRHDKLGHMAGNGTTFRHRMGHLARVATLGEAVGWLPDGIHDRAKAVVDAWMDSPPHRHQLMRGSFKKVGIGRWYGAMGKDPGIVVTVDFATNTT